MASTYARDLSTCGSPDAVVIGMPYDGIATFRGGATRRAPQEIRKYSPLFGSYHFDWDLNVADHVKIADCGDIDVVAGDTPESYRRLEVKIGDILKCRARRRRRQTPA